MGRTNNANKEYTDSLTHTWVAGLCPNYECDHPTKRFDCRLETERNEQPMSLVKICGLRREIDIEYANMLKPDFIGFVFAESRRRVTESQALALKRRLDPCIKSVGVFVNAGQNEILELCQSGVIDLIQLHGDEDNDYISALKARVNSPVIKSLHFGPKPRKNEGARFHNATDRFRRVRVGCAQDNGCPLPHDATDRFAEERVSDSIADFLLFDTLHDKQRGGSGEIFDWSLIGETEKPFFLAGGLNIDNVEAAVRGLKPYAVDVSSGVETGGYKDYDKMSLFINIVRCSCTEGGNAHDQ